MSATVAFLEKILPPEDSHWYIAAIFKDGRCQHRWYWDRLSLAADLVAEDRKGNTVYHACAVFRDRDGGRKATNAASAAALWTDIDAGEGKQFETAAGAHDAMVAFCRSTGLPRPLFVGSGFGVHCYWPLGVCVDPETWKAYAGGLAALLRQHKIKNERTTDLASILRPVGTSNRKKGIVPVTLIAAADDFEISDLRLQLDVVTPKISTSTIVNGATLASKLGVINSRPRYSSGLRGCGQLRYRDSRGYVPEPLWHLALGVFAFIEGDGDEAAHEWSSEDDRYDHPKTQERLDRIRASTSGPTTCARFHQDNPETCEACPHWQKIKSPIALCSGSNQSGNRIQSDELSQTSEILDLPSLPENYAWSNNKLCEVHEDKAGNQVELVISEHPIYFNSAHERESRDGHSLYYRQYIRSSGWHDIVVSAGTLHSNGGRAEFSNNGANISDWSAFVRYSIAAINMQYCSDDKQPMMYSQFGWKDNDTSFLYGLDLYTPIGIRRVVGDRNVISRTGSGDRDGNKPAWVGPSRGGNLSQWSDAANKLFATGAEAQSVALCASFGAAFQRFLSRDEGGPVISLCTHRGGRGKSTALQGSYSVWGHKLGLTLENIDSSISKVATLASIGNIPLFYDQFDTTDPVIVRNFIDMFTNGRDKRRMGRDGTMADPGMQWQTILFTASNASLVDSIESIGNSALASRIFEMSVDIPDHLKEIYQGEKLKNQLLDNAGHAGAAFLSKLMAGDNLVRAKHRLEYWHPIICQQAKLDTEHRFWARLATSVAVAAEIISSGEKIVLFDPGRIMEWLMREIVSNRVETFGHDGWEIDALSSFMNSHSLNQIVVYGPFIPGQNDATVYREPKRELLIRREKLNNRIYISKEQLRRWCVKQGLDTRELLIGLCEMGICLNRSKNITLGAGTNWAATRTQCIEIDGSHEKISEGKVGRDADVLPFKPRDEPSDQAVNDDIPY